MKILFLIIFCITFIKVEASDQNIKQESLKKTEVALLKKEKNKEDKNFQSSIHPQIFYLSTIVYCDKDHWTIWLNDEQITPSQAQHLNFNILVMPDCIKIKQIDSEKEAYTLKPHQTIDLKTGRIFCGDIREKLDKDEKNQPIEGEDFDF
ncbi:MAG: hypothetical protein KBD31_04505 [Proteobacteria bacterium]|nr:hypothetical protein [Pseudomonadota bacterium]